MDKRNKRNKKNKHGFFEIYNERSRKVVMIRSALLGAALVLAVCIFAGAIHLAYGGKKGNSSKKGEVSITTSGTDVQADLVQAEENTDPVTLTVSFAGDCTLGTDANFDYSTSLNAYYENYGADYFLKNVRSIFQADDLTIVNFEGTLTTSDDRCENQFAFKGDPEYASILTGSSVEAVNVANNHSHDYGEEGFSDTLTNLENAGLTVFGYDETAVIEIKGVKVGLVGIYELFDHLGRSDQLKENIEKVKNEGAQLIIVSFHWGNEKETEPDSNEVTLGQLAIDLGADIVVGHHPHVIQPVEKYNGRYIVYSLANFCFGGNSSPSDTDTFIFQQTFTITGDDVAQDDDINIIPCSVTSADGYNNYQPTPVEDEDEAARITQRVTAYLDSSDQAE